MLRACAGGALCCALLAPPLAVRLPAVAATSHGSAATVAGTDRRADRVASPRRPVRWQPGRGDGSGGASAAAIGDTPTDIPSGTPTASATPSPSTTGTPTPTACPLQVAVVPPVIQQGGSLALRFTSLPGAAVDAVIGASYPPQAWLFAAGSAPTSLAGATDSAGFRYTVATGSDGVALLSFPIPSGAPLTTVGVSATATFNLGQSTRSASFDVVPAQVVPFAGHLALASHDVPIRSVQLPPAAGGVVHDAVSVTTDATVQVTLSVAIVSTMAGSLGTAADGGTARASGDIVYTAIATSDTGGSAAFSLPIDSSLLRPGRGAVLRIAVTCATGGGGAVYRTSIPIREARLRLIVRPRVSTRGGRRQQFPLGHTAGGSSTLSVLIVADRGAHVTGSLAIGGLSIAPAAPQIAGPGGRATLRFRVPNALAPPAGAHDTGTLTVQSSFRGAAIVRSAAITYARA